MDDKKTRDILAVWKKLLVGKKIVGIDFMSIKDCKEFDWYNRPVVIILSDGTQLVPASDDECNNGGVIQIYNEHNYNQTHTIKILSNGVYNKTNRGS